MLTTIKNAQITDVVASIRYLLEKSSADARIRELAVSITQNGNDNIASIYKWTKSNIKYVPDPVVTGGADIELFISPSRMVEDWGQGKALGGDCDDQAIFNTALFRSIGMNARVVLLDTGGGGIDHAICEVFSNPLNKYVMVDTTAPLPLGWAEKYFNRIEV